MHQVTKRQITIALDELSIKVNIADRFYPLVLKPEEEEQVRNAARLINEKLKTLQQEFSVKDKQDMLAMTALELATQLIAIKSDQLIEDKGLSDQLLEIRALLKHLSV